MSGKIGTTAAERFLTDLSASSAVRRVFGNLRFHTDGDILALAFTPDGKLWSVEEPGTLRQWDTTTGQPVTSTLLSDLETLWTFSHEGKALVSSSDEISMWETATGQMIGTIPQPSWPSAIAIWEKPALVATGHDDGVVRLWDAAPHKQVRELGGHDRPISALAFSPDGKRLASAGEDRIICIWEVATGRLLGTLGRHTDHIGALSWHPDGVLLVSAAWDRTARVWNTDTFQPVILLNSHDDQVTALAFSPDGQVLACADSAHTIHLWDPVAGQDRHVLREHQEEIQCLAFSADGHLLASGGTDRVIYMWDPANGQLLSGRGKPALPQNFLSVSNDGTRLASTCAGADTQVWDVATGKTLFHLEETSPAQVLAGSPDGRWIATGREDTKIRVWDAKTGRLHTTLEGPQGRACALAFSPDSASLASASAIDGTVWLWDLNTKEPALVIPLAADACSVETLAFHPEGKLLAAGGIDWMATGGSDGAVCIWDIAKREQVVTFNRGSIGAAFHPSGRWLATASLHDSICVWDLSTENLLFELGEHSDAVTCVAYSPDGRWLASGSEDRWIRLWSSETGELAASADLNTPVLGLTFSPDSKSLFAANGNTTSCQIDVQQLLEEE